MRDDEENCAHAVSDIDTSIAPMQAGVMGILTRVAAGSLTLLGLATFGLRIISIDLPVLGQTRWSPLDLVTDMLAGTLPVDRVNAASVWIGVAVFGFGFIYLALGAILVAILAWPSSRFVLLAAGFAVVDVVWRYRHFYLPDYTGFDVALCGHAGVATCAGKIHVNTWSLLMLAILGMLALLGLVHEVVSQTRVRIVRQ